ncbi:unnamed protein product [Rhizopus stolonifer]
MPARTAQGWYDGDQEDTQDVIQRKQAKFHEEHREFLVELIDKKPALFLDQVMDALTSQFMRLKVSKTALYDFMTDKCRISLKKAHFHSVDRNSPDSLEQRHDWVTR